MSGAPSEDEPSEDEAFAFVLDPSAGGSERKTRTLHRRWWPISLASSTWSESGRMSDTLPLAVTHSCGSSNANAPGGGRVFKPSSAPHDVATTPSSHAPSHRTNLLQSSESSHSLWTSAGAPSETGAGSFGPSSIFFTFLTSFLPPLVMFTMASHSSFGTKFGMAKTGGSTLSTRTPPYERSTGRNRSASEPRYACWFCGDWDAGSRPPDPSTCGGSLEMVDCACAALRSFSGGGQCQTRVTPIAGASAAAARHRTTRAVDARRVAEPVGKVARRAATPARGDETSDMA